MIRGIKQIFGIYETGHEYWVRTDSIKVPINFLIDRYISKLDENMDHYLDTGEFKSKIYLHRDFTLANGYLSLSVARITGLEKVPVYFVD